MADTSVNDGPSESAEKPETRTPTKGRFVRMRFESDDEDAEEDHTPSVVSHEQPSSPLIQVTGQPAKPLFLESESESDDSRAPERPSLPLVSSTAKTAPRSVKVTGRRIDSDSDLESDSPIAMTPKRPPQTQLAGPSSSTGPKSATNQAHTASRRTAIIDLSSDEDEPLPPPTTNSDVDKPGYVSVIGTDVFVHIPKYLCYPL